MYLSKKKYLLHFIVFKNMKYKMVFYGKIAVYYHKFKYLAKEVRR